MVLDVRNLVPGQTKTMLGKTEKPSKKRTAKSDSEENSEPSIGDSVEITSQANQINRLVQQMKSEPVLDPDRVAPIKQKLSDGDYQIKYEHVANKMLDFESGYSGY